MSDEDDAVATTERSNDDSPSPSRSPPPPSARESSPPPLQQFPPPPSRTPAFPAREDCWSEAATYTLIDAWGSHYIELNRGNLRQKHWQEVADAVNALHGHTKRQFRTDIQCKNRIDTLKKKYKIEKARVSQSNGRYVSSWPFFNSLDSLIGDNFKPSPSPAPATAPQRKTPLALPPPPSAVPVAPRSKRPLAAAAASEEAVSRRNFSAMAAAAAAAAADEEEESETSSAAAAVVGAGGGKREGNAMSDGYRRLAEAIMKFGEIYEKVEEAKQRQMVELEKQRMQFAKDLEIQRMKLYMESQVHLEKVKRVKRNSPTDGYS